VQPDIEAERKKRDEIEAGKSYCSRRFGGATCDDKSAQIYARFDKNDWRIQPAEFYRFHDSRFPAPVEFIAAVIAYYVHPVNIQTACLIMEGAEFTENIINGVERPVKAAELFAFTLRVRAGNT